MLRRFSAHLNYANVMATIAVMIALGATRFFEISINLDDSLNNFFKENAKVPNLSAPTQIGCVYNWTDILGPRT